ncbi:MAG TPA: 2-hydroxyacyl-CoA dehydratase family protein [Smithella sp.]|nr:2-hydroxyacyl-CoA dehydratase family protein [Smithella sp.]
MTDADHKIKSLKDKGGRIIGCFPLYPPLELFHSMGLTPVVLWGLRDFVKTSATADRHLQSYACSVARHLVEFVLSDQGRFLDGLFMYNACDTLRNLPEILNCGLGDNGRALPIFKTHIPMTPPKQTSAAGYLNARILALIMELEETYGVVFSPARFRHSVALYREARSLCKELEILVAKGSLSYGRFSQINHAGYFSTVEDHIKLLKKVLNEDSLSHTKTSPSAVPVIISGILPPPPGLIVALEDAGFRVAANDIASERRSYDYAPDTADNPCSYYADFYFNHFPCPTLLYSADKRIAMIKKLAADSGARGFVFIGEKFCEDEYFEIPHLERILKETGVAILPLEISIEDDANNKAYVTRLEAFHEMLRG